MSLRWKIVVLAILPFLVASLAVALEVGRQSRLLTEQQAELIEASLMEQKRTELRHAIALIEGELQVLDDDRNQERAAEHAKALIAAAHYGDDGYFFAYDRAGTCLVHPMQPDLVGSNLWELRDARGRRVIPGLVETAQRGSGFQRYEWRKPSTGRSVEKLAYVARLPRFGWVLGTGVYLDDVAAATERVRTQARGSVTKTMQGLVAVALLAIGLVFASTLGLTVTEQRLADARLRAANERLAKLREREQAHLARELHEGVLQLLAAAKLELGLAAEKLTRNREDAARSLALGIEPLARAMTEVRAIVYRSPRTPITTRGWSRALSELVRDFASRSGAKVDFDGNVEDAPPEPYASELYQIVQECLTNIERHARAKNVELEVRRDASGALTLRIHDDGCGFDPESVDDTQHAGVRHIRERVADLDGTLRIESRPGSTELCVHLKVDRMP
jgi:two-component system NarL family sensor kinase